MRVWISGKVQGVYFRESLRQQAEMYAVTGWARNLADGRVEAVLGGDLSAVSKVVNWCRTGPPNAEVAGIEVESEPEEVALVDFQVQR